MAPLGADTTKYYHSHVHPYVVKYLQSVGAISLIYELFHENAIIVVFESWFPCAFNVQFNVEGRKFLPEKNYFIVLAVIIPAGLKLKEKVFCSTDQLLFVEKDKL